MHAGFTLDDYPARISLYAIYQFFRHANRGSNVFRAMHDERAEWGYVEELLARLIESTWDANWQRAGKPHAPKPKPLQRPWEVAPKTTQHFGDHAVTITEFHKLWDRKAA